MRLNLLVAPDFAPECFGGWYMLNALLQARSGMQLRLQIPATAQEQSDCLSQGQVDLVYANPFDASHLIRNLGFRALAMPVDKPDEMVIAAASNSPLTCIDDIKAGDRIALTDHRDVKLIGLRLLEAADLREPDLSWTLASNYQAAARLVIKQEVSAAFFLAENFKALSAHTRGQLRVLMQSHIGDISHVLLAHQRIADAMPALSDALTGLGSQDSDREVLQALGMPSGFKPMQQEDAEFMIDLMDTLLD